MRNWGKSWPERKPDEPAAMKSPSSTARGWPCRTWPLPPPSTRRRAPSDGDSECVWETSSNRHRSAQCYHSAMNQSPGKRSRVRATPRGRRVDPAAREEVVALLGDAPRRRDLLIEHLHRIQDRFGCLSAAHLVALADEMKMAMAEVYEVATFYHHFDVVKDGEQPPPPITVRVCDSIAC